MTAVALPNQARAKWAGLLDAEDEAAALVSASVRRIGELQKAIDMNPNGDNVANHEYELTRLRAKQGEQQSRHQARAFLNASIKTFLQGLPADAALEPCKPIKPKLEKGETPAIAVDRLRQRIAVIRQELTRTQQAPPPIAEVKAKALEYVKALQARGRPRIISTADKFEVSFLDPQSYSTTPDMNAILAWLDPIALAKKLDEEIDNWPKPELALSAKAKRDRLAMLSMELFEVEREEEAHISKSEIEGPAVPRRPNSDPRAILCVIVGRRKATTAAA
jgi:hypothetical protein